MNNTNRDDLFATPTIFIDRHSTVGLKTGFYHVVTRNLELAYAQGVKPGNAHYNAVADDFGNLVRVPQ
jgi:hypothetical protein